MRATIQHEGQWLHFKHPERVLRAECMDDVLPMLREAERSNLFVVGFVSYEASAAFDTALVTHPMEGFPLLCFGLFNAPEVLDQIEVGGEYSVSASSSHLTDAYKIGEFTPSISRNEFIESIGKVKERIAEGATYQVNYTYRLNAPFSGDASAFFCELVQGQQTDYAAFIDVDDFAICSVSPELFFSFKAGEICMRPMKGTARRGRTFLEDWQQAEALRVSEKDRAENIMIVDMVRNDMGRIIKLGSLDALSQFDVEKYPTVWQMTSTVCGQIEPQGDANEEGVLERIFGALFPCASITGAPKAKTMEIIRELETLPRKVYTGAVGFMTPQREAFFNVAIRTALIDRKAGHLEFGVGGGIVWDSDAEAEYEETLTKARVLTEPRPEFQLLETLLWEPELGFFLLNEHLQRLTKSAAYFDVPLDPYLVLQSLEAWTPVDDGASYKVRMRVSCEGALKMEATSIQKIAGAASLVVSLAKEPVDSKNIFLFHKTTHRVVYEKARAACPAADEVILWNEHGEVTEGSVANVVIRRAGQLLTPPVECGLLAGTFREYLLKTGEISEKVVRLDDLKNADEIFLINSVKKWQRANLR